MGEYQPYFFQSIYKSCNLYLYNDADPLQLTPKSLYLGNDQTLLFWEDLRNAKQIEYASYGNEVITSTVYVFGELIDGNFGYMDTNNGTVFSQTLVQTKPSIKSYNGGYLYHFIGNEVDSGENQLRLDYLEEDFFSTNTILSSKI